MARKIFIAATGQNCGKTTTCVSLLHLAQKKYQRIGFIKPLGPKPTTYRGLTVDKDAALIAQVFGLTRDELAVALAAENIDTRKYYEPPVHRQTAYAAHYDGRPLLHTDWLSAASLSFPMWSNMDPQVVMRISEAIQRIYQNRAAVKQCIG